MQFLRRPAPQPPTLDGSPIPDERAAGDENILVARAGDARANGLYLRDGAQNGAPRWRHADRAWLCILRDGTSWWIGAEKAAREDLHPLRRPNESRRRRGRATWIVGRGDATSARSTGRQPRRRTSASTR